MLVIICTIYIYIYTRILVLNVFKTCNISCRYLADHLTTANSLFEV